MVIGWALTTALYRFDGVMASSVRGKTTTYVGVDGVPGVGKPGIGGDDGAAVPSVQL